MVARGTLAALRWRRDRRRLRIASAPPTGTVGVAYEAALDVKGGLAPYSLTVVGGALPAGLSATDSTVSGEPEAAGTDRVTFLIEDAGGVRREWAADFVVLEA